jgi:hypothetical protein
MILSELEYGSQLKRLKTIHNKEELIALRAFCTCTTENILYESCFEDLKKRRKRKIIKMALHIAEEVEHPMNQLLENRRVYNQALEVCSAMEVELGMVKKCKTTEYSLWTNMSAENVIIELMANPRVAEIDKIRANMKQITNKNGLQEYHRIFTDESLIGNQVGCKIVTAQTKIKLRLAETTTIFNTELEAILESAQTLGPT